MLTVTIIKKTATFFVFQASNLRMGWDYLNEEEREKGIMESDEEGIKKGKKGKGILHIFPLFIAS